MKRGEKEKGRRRGEGDEFVFRLKERDIFFVLKILHRAFVF